MLDGVCLFFGNPQILKPFTIILMSALSRAQIGPPEN